MRFSLFLAILLRLRYVTTLILKLYYVQKVLIRVAFA